MIKKYRPYSLKEIIKRKELSSVYKQAKIVINEYNRLTMPDTETVNEEPIEQVQPTLERKGRSDKGKPRAKYDSSIPLPMRIYIGRANKKGIEFSLSIEEFNAICSSRCVYCGSGNKIGIDRKDSSIGYVIDNCQPACSTCNMMKYTSDEDSFLQQIIRIYKHRLT